METLLLLLALISFLVGIMVGPTIAERTGVHRFNLVALGLAFWVGSQLLGHFQ